MFLICKTSSINQTMAIYPSFGGILSCGCLVSFCSLFIIIFSVIFVSMSLLVAMNSLTGDGVITRTRIFGLPRKQINILCSCLISYVIE